MKDAATAAKIHDLEHRIDALRAELRAARQAVPPEKVEDYGFLTLDGPVHLSGLFGDRRELFVVHNMGKTCVACTMWADGYNGVLAHLESRAALVLASPDDPATQRDFAAARGWRFRMVSYDGPAFAEAMGFHSARGYGPGISVFQRQADGIVRVNATGLGAHDDFCTIWPLFNLLPGGAGDWRPKFSYAA